MHQDPAPLLPKTFKPGEARHVALLSVSPAIQVFEDDAGEGYIVAGAGIDPRAKAGDRGWLVFERADRNHGYWRFFRDLEGPLIWDCKHDPITGHKPDGAGSCCHREPARQTVVTGLGRCGSTLTMWMLWAAGVETFYSHEMRPSQETNLALLLPNHAGWMEAVAGRACKILDPHIYVPPREYQYDFIFLRRHPLEQARSQVKLITQTTPGLTLRPDSVDRMRNSIEQDEPTVRSLLMGYYGARVLEVKFEDLVADPAKELRDMQDFLRRPLNIERAAQVLIPRPPGCLPDMTVETRIMESCKQAQHRP